MLINRLPTAREKKNVQKLQPMSVINAIAYGPQLRFYINTLPILEKKILFYTYI